MSGDFPVQFATSRTRSSPTCPPICPTRALFLARILARKSVGDARVYTYTFTVHDKLSCTHARLQNYTIGASLKSVSVSVPWNYSYTAPYDNEPYRTVPCGTLNICTVYTCNGIKEGLECLILRQGLSGQRGQPQASL